MVVFLYPFKPSIVPASKTECQGNRFRDYPILLFHTLIYFFEENISDLLVVFMKRKLPRLI